jgi:hypothetical protein
LGIAVICVQCVLGVFSTGGRQSQKEASHNVGSGFQLHGVRLSSVELEVLVDSLASNVQFKASSRQFAGRNDLDIPVRSAADSVNTSAAIASDVREGSHSTDKQREEEDNF